MGCAPAGQIRGTAAVSSPGRAAARPPVKIGTGLVKLPRRPESVRVKLYIVEAGIGTGQTAAAAERGAGQAVGSRPKCVLDQTAAVVKLPTHTHTHLHKHERL